MTTFTAVDFQTGNSTSCTRTGVQTLTPELGGLLIVEDLRDDLEGDEFVFSRKFFASGLVPAPDRCPGLDTWTHVPWLTTDIPDTGLLPWPGQSAGKLQGTSSADNHRRGLQQHDDLVVEFADAETLISPP